MIDIRILWLSNMPFCNVGYGQITRNLLTRINKKHPSALHTNYGIGGYSKLENYSDGFIKDIPIYGSGSSSFDEQFIPINYRDFNADVYIPIYDVWAHNKVPELVRRNRMIYVPYVPIDTNKMNPIYQEHLNSAFKIIPMSKHSEKCIKEHFPDKCLNAIYPGVNTSIFKPMWDTIQEKNKLKIKAVGFKEDDFVISLMGDIKGYRKSWAENIEGIRIFKENNPDIKVKVYFHSLSRIINPMDFNVPELLKQNGLSENSRMIDQYSYLRGIKDEDMAELYNASDVYLCASRGEGFGMCYIEAASCGTPSINTDFTSGREVVEEGKTGFLAKPLFLQTEPMIAKKAIPDPYSIAEQLSIVVNSDPMTFRRNGPEFAKKFDWDVIEKQWLETLERLEIDIDRACYNPPSKKSEYISEREKKISII